MRANLSPFLVLGALLCGTNAQASRTPEFTCEIVRPRPQPGQFVGSYASVTLGSGTVSATAKIELRQTSARGAVIGSVCGDKFTGRGMDLPKQVSLLLTPPAGTPCVVVVTSAPCDPVSAPPS